MNKFQKVALQMAKDDRKKVDNVYKDELLKYGARGWYAMFKGNKSNWTYLKALDFKNWNKTYKS